MASSSGGTPSVNFVTPKKTVISRTPADEKNCTPRSNFRAPINNYCTPKNRAFEFSLDTPECFANVSIETPISYKNRFKESTSDQISNLTVAVRVRPMNARELACVSSTDIVSVREKELIIRVPPNGVNSVYTDHIFQYDHVFWSSDESNPLYATQEDVFMTVGMPLLNSAFRGYNACLFAYGQTGSGKSFSMMGKSMCEIVDIDSETNSGITPRFCRDLFKRISKLPPKTIATVEVSYFEIYNEKIHDLLANSTSVSRTALKVREHPEWGPYVVDLSIKNVKSYKELRNWLIIGNKNRATAATSMNDNSSRSHSIFSIELCLSEDLSNNEESSHRSKVSLIDLAGSERLGNSHASEEKIRQGVCINKSLLTLGKVISALADERKKQFVPYRDSVLTWLLKESLGGNSLTSMLATISPASTHLDETLATLRYACQARSIVNRARVNENPHDLLIRELRLEVERLRALRQDYERHSLSSSSIILINDSNNDELEKLRKQLTETENKLLEAQTSWEQRFMESKENQQRELAEAEKYKAELESRVRVLKTADSNVRLSPYRTNFLKELEGVLTEGVEKINESEILENIKIWCCQNGFVYIFDTDSLVITDPSGVKQAILFFSDLNVNKYKSLNDILNSLTWIDNKKNEKRLSKTEIMSSMNQIYHLLNNLQLPEDNNNLNLLLAKVNKSLQNFETALLNSVKNIGQKSVTFNM